MLIEALAMILTAAAPQKAPALLIAPASLLATTPTPTYAADKRAVDNWRKESALNLEMPPLAALRRAAEADDDSRLARCVKLNNYWCIKSAGWPGQIAADLDGHVAFASAEEGAAVAALLLRRYYVDHKRRSARAIVERWAPAQCSPSPSPFVGAAIAHYARRNRVHTTLQAPAASRAGMARMLPQRVVTMGGLAPFGIQNTARARWLAAHGRGGVATPTTEDLAARDRKYDAIRQRNAARVEAATQRVEAYRAANRTPKMKMLMAPSIMEGGGETPRAEGAALSDTPSGAGAPFGGIINCSGELARIANYATNLALGVTTDTNADLHLFDAAGRPTENLARVMLNMAAVEIGPDRPREFLVAAAVTQLRRMLENPATALNDDAKTPVTNATTASEPVAAAP